MEHECLHIPSELHFLMAGAQQIAVVERRGYFYVWPYDYNFIASHVRLLSRSKLRGAQNLTIYDLGELRSDVAVYRGRTARAGRLLPAHGDYGVVNKVSNFLLMPIHATGKTDAGATERFWESLEGYHEHLAADRQAAFAHRISSWFAEEVLRPLAPQSFMEIGCGAGRNLLYARRTMPDARAIGIDINPHAVSVAAEQLGAGASVRQGSVYDLGQFPDGSIDVLFSMGVLMHIAHDRVAEVVEHMHRIARVAVIHLECHGPSYSFDYHKYPRNYEELYRRVGSGLKVDYTVYQREDFRSRESAPFYMALLIGRK